MQTIEEVRAHKRKRDRKRKAEGICKDCGLGAEPKCDGTYKVRCGECSKKHNRSNHGQIHKKPNLGRDFRTCSCGGVYYEEYNYCPYCGKEIKNVF